MRIDLLCVLCVVRASLSSECTALDDHGLHAAPEEHVEKQEYQETNAAKISLVQVHRIAPDLSSPKAPKIVYRTRSNVSHDAPPGAPHGSNALPSIEARTSKTDRRVATAADTALPKIDDETDILKPMDLELEKMRLALSSGMSMQQGRVPGNDDVTVLDDLESIDTNLTDGTETVEIVQDEGIEIESWPEFLLKVSALAGVCVGSVMALWLIYVFTAGKGCAEATLQEGQTRECCDDCCTDCHDCCMGIWRMRTKMKVAWSCVILFICFGWAVLWYVGALQEVLAEIVCIIYLCVCVALILMVIYFDLRHPIVTQYNQVHDKVDSFISLSVGGLDGGIDWLEDLTGLDLPEPNESDDEDTATKKKQDALLKKKAADARKPKQKKMMGCF